MPPSLRRRRLPSSSIRGIFLLASDEDDAEEPAKRTWRDCFAAGFPSIRRRLPRPPDSAVDAGPDVFGAPRRSLRRQSASDAAIPHAHDAAEAVNADAADAAASTSLNLSEPFVEDDFLLSDEDPEKRAKREWRE